MSYIGLDIGISGVKAIIFSSEGKILKRAYNDYGEEYKRNIRTKGEQDPIHVLSGVKDVLKSCNAAGLKDRPRTIAVSVSGDDVFPSDKVGNPLANVIAGFSDRGFEFRDYIEEKMGSLENIYRISGQRTDMDIPALIRILWFQKNLPDVYKKTWKFLCWESYINHYLTGRAVTDYSNASRYATFDINSRTWSNEILDAFKISTEKMPEADISGAIIGKIKKDAAEELYLPENITVVNGGFDQATVALGAGIINNGMFSLGMGTVLCSHWMVDRFNPEKSHEYVYCNYLIPNKYFGFFVSLNGCSVLNWFIENFTLPSKGNNVFDSLDAKIKTNPSKLFFMPHLIGGPSPYNDPASRGTIIGLDIKTEKVDILKSIYEGLAFEVRSNYENVVNDNKIDINEIRAIGGGSRSKVWLQIMSNILYKTIALLEVEDAGCLSCAIIGAAAIKDFKNIEDAVGTFIRIKTRVYPEEDKKKLFDEKYRNYLDIYPRVKDLNRCLNSYNISN